MEPRQLLSAEATAEVLAAAAVPIVQLKVTAAQAAESGTPAHQVGKFVVSRSGPKAEPLVVRLTLGGTASPDDFVLTSGGVPISDTVTIPAGKGSATVIVAPVDDAIAEPLETLDISVQQDPAYSTDPKHLTGTVTIADNEPIVSVVAGQSATESDNPAKGNGSFTIKRTGSKKDPLVVNYSLGGTATPGVDYIGLAGVAIIPAGKSSVKLPVHAVLDTNITEGRETIIVTLTPEAAYHVSPTQPSAEIGIKNVFAMDTVAAFGAAPHTYTSTMHINYRGTSQPKSVTTADAIFPLDLLGFAEPTPVGSKYLIMKGTQDAGGVFLEEMQLWQRNDQSSSPVYVQAQDLELRFAQTQGSDVKGGEVQHDVLFIPAIVGPSSTRKLFANVAVNESEDTVPGKVLVTSKAVRQVSVKTPAGTFNTTKLVVTTTLTGQGNATVNAQLSRNDQQVTRRLSVSVNDQFTWTYYFAPGVGLVKAVASGSFKQTTEFTLSFKATYVMVPPAPSALSASPAPVTE